MFVNEEYSNYRYLVSTSDNYVVLSKSSGVVADWNNPKSVDVVYQYFFPSIYCVPSENTFTTTRDFVEIETSSDFYDRPDCPLLMLVIFAVVFFELFIINSLTKMFKRGGVLFGE